MKFRSIVDKFVSLILWLWNGIEQTWIMLGKFLRKEFFTIPWGFWFFGLAIWIAGVLLITLFVMTKAVEKVDQGPLTVGIIGALFVGTVGLFGLYVNYRRTRNFEDSTNKQRESDERRDHQHLYASSIQYLEHDKESVRLGSVYGLYRLAKDSQTSKHPWASNVAEILSSHIRSITDHPEYRSRNKPSNYIDTVLRLLVPRKQDTPEVSPFSSLEDFRLNLGGSHLPWANLKDLNMVNADLTDVDLTNADLTDADFRDADLTNTNLTNSTLKRVILGGAILKGTRVSLSTLKKDADWEGADLSEIIDIDKGTVGQKSSLSGLGGSLP